MFFCRYSWPGFWWKRNPCLKKTHALREDCIRIKLIQPGNRNPPRASLFKQNRWDAKDEKLSLKYMKISSKPSINLKWLSCKPLQPSRTFQSLIYRQHVNRHTMNWTYSNNEITPPAVGPPESLFGCRLHLWEQKVIWEWEAQRGAQKRQKTNSRIACSEGFYFSPSCCYYIYNSNVRLIFSPFHTSIYVPIAVQIPNLICIFHYEVGINDFIDKLYIC